MTATAEATGDRTKWLKKEWMAKAAARPGMASSSVPWKRLEVGFPLQPERGEIAKIVAHRRGTFGWQNGDWVSKRPLGRQFHNGVDIVGWMDPKGKEHSLRGTLCIARSTAVDYAVDDEHEQPSVVLRQVDR